MWLVCSDDTGVHQLIDDAAATAGLGNRCLRCRGGAGRWWNQVESSGGDVIHEKVASWKLWCV